MRGTGVPGELARWGGRAHGWVIRAQARTAFVVSLCLSFPQGICFFCSCPSQAATAFSRVPHPRGSFIAARVGYRAQHDRLSQPTG